MNLNSFIGEKKEEQKIEVERKPKLNSTLPWTKKYIAKSLSTVIGHKKELEKIKTFLDTFEKQKKKAILLWGASGVGKSMIPYTFAEELGYEFIELNASDKRNKAIIEEQLGNVVSQASLFGSKKIILIDDADGLSGMKDRGGASSIAKIAAKSAYPIFITAQEPFDKKLSPIRSKSTLIELQQVSTEDISKKVQEILNLENISFTKKDVDVIAKHAKGDIRAAITDAQMLTIGKSELDLTLLEELTDRLQNTSMQDALQKVFKGSAKESFGAFDSVPIDFDKIVLWMEYNMPLEYTKMTDRAKAYGYLSKANVFQRRIRRRQDWRLLVYVNFLLTAGISSAKDSVYQGQLQYKENTRILKMWQANIKYAKRNAIAEKIAEKTHSSKKDVIKNFAFYKGFLPIVADELELSEEEIAWVKT